jgi:hypothetical protein
MNWKTIRLELGQTPEHPSGSPGRAYLIRLPLEDDGSVDVAALKSRPAQATVRRFWPSQPDRIGLVEQLEGGLTLRFNGADCGPIVATLEHRALRLGEEVRITEADGKRLPFRVANILKLA